MDPDAPSMKVTLSNHTDIIEGDNVTISCDVSSHPVSIVTLYDMTDMTPMDTLNTDNKAEYRFINIQCLDTGNYIFTAKNGIPYESAVVNLTFYTNVMCKLEHIFLSEVCFYCTMFF